MNEETRAERLEALRARMSEAGCGLAAVAPTDNLIYLLGFAPKYDERACMLLVSSTGASVVMPSLNAEQSAVEAPELELVRWSDDAGPVDALRTALEQVGANGSTVAVDGEMRADHLLLLQAALPDSRTVSATDVLGALRVMKSRQEIDALQAAANAADEAVLAAFAACRSGAAEAEVAEAVAASFAAQGQQPIFAIVGGGPNGAYPHHHTSARPLAEGDAVVIDIGGRGEAGYVSDITRMAFVGEPTERYREVHAVVEAAVQAGMAAARPGAACEDVDAAARGVIADAGFGDYFVHRTGHGLGLSVHEPPWIMRGDETELRVGMVHSIEPGIYLPGEFGVRLEEIVSITEDGCSPFSALPRDVHVVGAGA
jgi:Xaa-Pro aminopeptidase